MKKTRIPAATIPIIIGMPTKLAPPLKGTVAVVLFAERPVAVPEGVGAVPFAPELVGYGGPLGLIEIVGRGVPAG